jgi:hypothetical protein
MKVYKTYIEVQESVAMGKYKESPKYNVVSIRISDQEKQALEELTKERSMSISSLMREAILIYAQTVGNLRPVDI